MAANNVSRATKAASRAKKPRTLRAPGNAIAPKIRFTATLLRPATKTVNWSFLLFPKTASAKLPSRGMNAIQGTFNDTPFHATLEPDGKGGHWLKVDPSLRDAARVQAGDTVALEIAPATEEPEPTVPPDLQKALTVAHAITRAMWADITPAARRDFIQWIESAKREETRLKRVDSACDMLAKGKRRPCCFDRSGMYSNSMICPIADKAHEYK